jgi:hypothetical protein
MDIEDPLTLTVAAKVRQRRMKTQHCDACVVHIAWTTELNLALAKHGRGQL